MAKRRAAKTLSGALTQTSPIPAEDAAPFRDVGDGLQNVLSGIGTTRDKRTYNQYLLTAPLTRQDLEAMYTASWVIRKIVDIVAKDMTRTWVNITWDGHEDEEGGAKELLKSSERFQTRKKVTSGLKWSRLYGGAAIVMGIRGESDQDMAKPLIVESIKKDSLDYLLVLDRWWLTPMGQIDRKRGSPNYGLPTYYQLTNISDTVPNIHWSRIIRFDGAELPKNLWLQNNMWHGSVVQTCLESIKDYEFGRASMAALLNELNIDVLKMAQLARQLSEKDGESKVLKRVQLGQVMKGLKTLILDKDTEDFERRPVTLSGFDKILEPFAYDLCGAAGIPATKFFGRSPGGLNSTGESDESNYYDALAADQETDLQPQLQRLFEVHAMNTFGRIPEGFTVTCNPLWEMSETEKTTNEKTRADRDKVYFDMGAMSAHGVAKELLERGTYATLDQDDVDLVKDLEEQAEAAAEAQVAAASAKASGGAVKPGDKPPAARKPPET